MKTYTKESILAQDGGERYIREHFEQEGYTFPQTESKRYNSRKWQGKRSSRISIQYKPDGGYWRWTDYNGDASGDALDLVASNNHLDIKRDFPKILEILAAYYGVVPSDKSRAINKPKAGPKKPVYPYQVNHNLNTHPEPSVSYTYIVDPKPVTNYYKGDIRPQVLADFGLESLISITDAYGRTTYATPEDPMYVIKAGPNTKIIRPAEFRDKDGHLKGKQRPASYQGNYVLGYDRLPKECKHILICAGQNDTMLGNDLLNDVGIYAVCLWSEGSASYLTPELLALLQKRCKSVFVAYDNDETGNGTAKKIREIYGLNILNIPHRYGLNDICDAVKEVGRDQVRRDMLEAIKQARMGREVWKDQTGKKDPWVYNFAPRIHDAIDEFPLLMLQAPTGSGKTRAFLYEQFCIAKQLYVRYEKRVIFVAPTNILTRQAAEKYGIPYVDGDSSKIDREIARAADVCATTYDSVKHVSRCPGDEILIIDEAHEMAFAGYRDNGDFQTCKYLFDLAKSSFRAVLLSATPPPFFESQGFKYIEIEAGIKKNVTWHHTVLKGDGLAELKTLTEKFDHRQGRLIIRFNDISASQALALSLEASGCLPSGMRATCVNGKNKNTSPDAEYIIKNNCLPDDVAVCFFTKMADTGLNLNNKDIAAAVIVGKSNPYLDEWIQFIARPRETPHLDVYLMLQGQAELKEYDGIQSHFSTLMGAANSELASISRWEDVAKYDRNDSQYIDMGERCKRNPFYRVNAHTGDGEIDFLEVLRKVNTEANKARTTDDIIEYLIEKTGHYFAGTFSLEKGNIKGLKAAKEEIQEKRRDSDATINSLLCENPRATLEACYHFSENRGLAQHLRKSNENISTPKPSEEAKATYEANREAFDHASFIGAHRFLNLLNARLSISEAISIFTTLSGDYQGRRKDALTRQLLGLVGEIERLSEIQHKKQLLMIRDAREWKAMEKDTARKRRLHERMKKRHTAMIRRNWKILQAIEQASEIEARINQPAKVWFTKEDWKQFIQRIELQKLLALHGRAETRETLSPEQMEDVTRLKPFFHKIGRGYLDKKGQTLSAKNGLKIFRQCCGDHLEEASMDAFLRARFDLEKFTLKGCIYYRILGRISRNFFATTYGINFDAWLVNNRRDWAVMADFKREMENVQNSEAALNNILISPLEFCTPPVLELTDVPF